MKIKLPFNPVFFKGEMYLIHDEYENEIRKFLEERATSVKYIERHYDVSHMLELTKEANGQ